MHVLNRTVKSAGTQRHRLRARCIAALIVLAAGSVSAQWKYTTEKSAMTDKVTATAMLSSSTKVNLGFPYKGGTNSRLYLMRETGARTRAVFAINNGQIVKSGGVSVTFDDTEVVEFDAEGADDGSTQNAYIRFPGIIKNCVPKTPTMNRPRPTQLEPGMVRPLSDQQSDYDIELVSKREIEQAVCKIDDKHFAQRLGVTAQARVQVTLFREGSHVFEFKPVGLKWTE